MAGETLDHLLLARQRLRPGHVALPALCRPSGVRLHFELCSPITQERRGDNNPDTRAGITPWPWLTKKGAQSRPLLTTATRTAGTSRIAEIGAKWLQTNPRQSTAIPDTSRPTPLQQSATPPNASWREEPARKSIPASEKSRCMCLVSHLPMACNGSRDDLRPGADR